MNSTRFRTLTRVLAALAVAAAMAIGAAAPATADPGEWDPTLPARPSSGAPGDPVAIANASFQVSKIALETTQSLGSKFLQSIGLAPAPAASTGGLLPGARVRGPQAIEYVIRRGGSQIGVPYSWGGGTLTGPGPGVDYDDGKIGYDCSGFTRYAFAGVGVQIPKYSGDQYTSGGRAISPSQAKRGDLIFWGPGGSQHVAIYLGGGKMLEASGSAGKVTVSPLRTAGMSPHLVRVIES